MRFTANLAPEFNLKEKPWITTKQRMKSSTRQLSTTRNNTPFGWQTVTIQTAGEMGAKSAQRRSVSSIFSRSGRICARYHCAKQWDKTADELVPSMSTKTPWCMSSEPNGGKIRLFCFPYAGGGTVAFRLWQKYLPQAIRVCPVQLPGRGPRIGEPAFTDLNLLVQSAASALGPYFDQSFAFFGHSMGALIAFELARLLQFRKGPAPLHLFLAGQAAPHLPRNEAPMHQLPQPELVNALRH